MNVNTGSYYDKVRGNIGERRVVAGKHNDLVVPGQVLYFEPRHTHLDSQILYFL